MNVSALPIAFWIIVPAILWCYLLWKAIRPKLVRKKLRKAFAPFETLSELDVPTKHMIMAAKENCLETVPKLSRGVVNLYARGCLKNICEVFFPKIQTDNQKIADGYLELQNRVGVVCEKYVDRWCISGWLINAQTRKPSSANPYRNSRLYRILMLLGNRRTIGTLSVIMFVIMAIPLIAAVIGHNESHTAVEPKTSLSVQTIAFSYEAALDRGPYQDARNAFLEVINFYVAFEKRRLPDAKDAGEMHNIVHSLEVTQEILSNQENDPKTSIDNAARLIASLDTASRNAGPASLPLNNEERETVDAALTALRAALDEFLAAVESIDESTLSSEDQERLFNLAQHACLRSRSAMLHLMAAFRTPSYDGKSVEWLDDLIARQQQGVDAIRDKVKPIVNKEYCIELEHYAESIENRNKILAALTNHLEPIIERLRQKRDKQLSACTRHEFSNQ